MLGGQARPSPNTSASTVGTGAIRFAGAGALTFVIVQLYLFATPPYGFEEGARSGWFLNSSRGVWSIAYGLSSGAAVMSFVANRRVWLQLYFIAGAVIAMTLVLFAIGPGNIFPIVFAFGTAIVLAAVVSGSLAGFVANVALRGVWQLAHRGAR